MTKKITISRAKTSVGPQIIRMLWYGDDLVTKEIRKN